MFDKNTVQQRSGIYIGLRIRYLATFSLVFLLLLASLYLWFTNFGLPRILQRVMTVSEAGVSTSNIAIDQATARVMRENFVAAWETQVWQNVSQVGLGVLLIFFLASVGVISLANAFTHRYIDTLTVAAREITAGRYDIDLSPLYNGRFRSEISELARAVESSGRVHLREQALKLQVAELTITLNHLQRASESGSIIETDSFQELKRRAVEMRSERSKMDNQPTSP